MAKKQATQLTKKEFDAKVKRFLELDESIKNDSKEHKDLKALLESQYQEGSEVKEIVHGNAFLMEKIPVNNGANKYDVELLKPFLKSIGKLNDVVETVEVVNTAKLDTLVKEGFIPSSVLDNARKDKWTFKSVFKHIESAVNTVAGKLKKAI